MKRILSIAATSLALILQSGVAWAATASESDASGHTPSHAAVPPAPASTSAETRFAGDACRVPADDAFAMAELGAFEHWQGAATVPFGHTETLVFGAMLQDVAIEPVVETQSGATTGTVASLEDSEASQRRRMFLLGLAILLNINIKQ